MRSQFDFLQPEAAVVRKRCSTSTVGRPILVATRPEAEWLPFVATIAEGYAIAALSESPSAAIGQVSADGQFRWDGAQWVPIPKGVREPTSWTRPLQLATAGVLLAQAVFTVASTLLTVNHDSVLRGSYRDRIEDSGRNDRGPVRGSRLVTIYVFAALISVGELWRAAAAFFGWRWAFWVLLVVEGVFSLGAVFGLVGFTRSIDAAIGEVISLLNVAIFVWMIVAVAKFGPWAMKKPGT
jgi:hypothetical protein